MRYYASLFPLVEVDSSYYAMPSAATAQLWVERTPATFTFNVKAFRLFTGHQTQTKVLHKDIRQALAPTAQSNVFYRNLPMEIRVELWRRFVLALAPLRQSGKLGLIHFQFPPWLKCNDEGHEHVRHCVEQMPGHAISIEFRHESWFEETRLADTLDFLRSLNAVHTVVDGPQGFTNSVPLIAATTHPDYALVRLHGRNIETYNIKGAASAAERFNYEYSNNELYEITGQIVRLATQVREMHVIFNNGDDAKSQRNALTLMKLLSQYQ